MRKILSFSFAALLVLAFCAFSAMAQSTTAGAISGTVKDPKGAAVPGATVTVKNNETNKEVTATTDDGGGFKAVNLDPGTYSVTVNAQGFAAINNTAVVEVGRTTSLDIDLSVQGTEATVEIHSEAPVINTTQQDFSSNINQTSINELPINGRRWSNFALLTPGAVPDGTFGLISFRGISGLLNNSTVDGGDNNQAFFAEERGRTRISYSISQAAIREFQVNTSSYSAEYGRSAGGVVNAVTKSGTNDFHGSAFYYQRNNKWGARNPRSFITQNIGGVFTPVAFKPEDVRHQFGATIGGPIVHDKAFFFFSYDEQRRNFPGVSTFTALDFLNRADSCLLTRPLAAATTLAQCPVYPGTTGSVNRNGTLGTGKGLTSAQVTNALNFLNGISGEVPRTGNQRLFLPKVDWDVNGSNHLTVTYNRLRWASPAGIQTQAINTRARDNFGDDFVNIDWLSLRLNSTINSSMLNEFRYQWGRDNEFQFSQPPLAGEPTTSVGGRSPQTFITNGFSFGIPEFLERVAFPDERRNQFADTMTWTTGGHTVKFGGDINFVKDIINNLRFSGGEFNYTGGVNAAGYYGGLNDFIIDYNNFLGVIPSTTLCYSSTRTAGKCYGGNFNQGLGVLGLTMKTTDVNFFAQDDWRATPRLTLNLGLRYEYQKNPTNIATRINPALPQTANRVNDRNNWGPRLGFAWDVKGDGKTAVRGGYGIYYGRVINSTVYNALINTGVGIDVAQRQVTLTASSAAAPSYPNLLTAGALVTSAVQYFANDFQLPLIHQGDFVFEREIARNTVVSASYLFSFGKNLPNFVDTNLPPPSRLVPFTLVGGPLDGQTWNMPIFTGARPNPGFAQITEIRSDVFSKYNALVLQANRRLTGGLQFQANYTLSRAEDNGQSSVTFTSNNLPFNAFDQANENGLSAFDRRQKFAASVVYTTHFASLKNNAAGRAILNGWTIAPILNAFSGQRYSGNVSGTVSPGGSGTSAPPGSGSNFGPGFGFAPGTATPGGGLNGSGGATRLALLPRNTFKQPNIWYVDLRLSRRFAITEGTKLELLAEGFNIFNRTQVTTLNTTFYSVCSTGTGASPCSQLNFNGGASGFGSVTGADSTLFRERQIQLAVRFEF